MDELENNNGYMIRDAKSFDRLFAMDRELLFQFLNDTQPDEMEYLRKIYKANLEETIVNFINTETTKDRGSLLNVLISGKKLVLLYGKPATSYNAT